MEVGTKARLAVLTAALTGVAPLPAAAAPSVFLVLNGVEVNGPIQRIELRLQ